MCGGAPQQFLGNRCGGAGSQAIRSGSNHPLGIRQGANSPRGFHTDRWWTETAEQANIVLGGTRGLPVSFAGANQAKAGGSFVMEQITEIQSSPTITFDDGKTYKSQLYFFSELIHNQHLHSIGNN